MPVLTTAAVSVRPARAPFSLETAAATGTAAPQALAAPAERAQIVGALLRERAHISPKYFYDQRGSQLFEAITELPEYYPTRTERAILQDNAQAIAAAVGPQRVVIEPGAGSCEKAHTLCALLHATHFIGMDISADYLQGAVQRLRAALPGLDARAVGGDITAGVNLPPDIPTARRLVFYPGSSIGNFDPPAAMQLLAQMHALAQGEEGGLLIGIDLPKDEAVLQAAYDDAAGVTGAFNRNVLVHVNRLIGSDFDPKGWRHQALFNRPQSRIEMHLVAKDSQSVRWPGGGRLFADGERIHTENSYKYPLPVFMEMLQRAGFRQPQAWRDDRGWFALVHARA